MAPYFHHFLQSVVKLEYFQALYLVSMEQWSTLTRFMGESFQVLGFQLKTDLVDGYSTIQLFSTALLKLDLPLLRVQLLKLLQLVKLELWLSLMFGWIVLSVAVNAYYLNTAVLEKKRETASATPVPENHNANHLLHKRPSPIDVHISSITTPYKSGFLQSRSNSNQAVLAPVDISSYTTPPGKKHSPPRVSPLTPDTGLNEIIRNIEDRELENEINPDDDENNEQDDTFSENYSVNSGMSKSFSETKSFSTHSMTTNQSLAISTNGRSHEYGPSRNMMHLEVLELSIQNPAILIGWKILVPTHGHGVILSMKRKKFHTTRFNIQFENYSNVIDLPLKRAKHKGKVPFTLVAKIK